MTVMSEEIERNSSGERLYKDITGAKCNLRGMMERDPEWVISRFGRMVAEIERLEDELTEARTQPAEVPDGVVYAQAALGKENERLKAHERELQTAIMNIDDLCVPPEQVAEATRLVGGPVGPYTVDRDHDAVVKRVADMLTKPSKPAVISCPFGCAAPREYCHDCDDATCKYNPVKKLEVGGICCPECKRFQKSGRICVNCGSVMYRQPSDPAKEEDGKQHGHERQ